MDGRTQLVRLIAQGSYAGLLKEQGEDQKNRKCHVPVLKGAELLRALRISQELFSIWQGPTHTYVCCPECSTLLVSLLLGPFFIPFPLFYVSFLSPLSVILTLFL